MDLGLDWYTSVTCTNVRWIKETMRDTTIQQRLNLSTDISSVLGLIFIGNTNEYDSARGEG